MEAETMADRDMFPKVFDLKATVTVVATPVSYVTGECHRQWVLCLVEGLASVPRHLVGRIIIAPSFIRKVSDVLGTYND